MPSSSRDQAPAHGVPDPLIGRTLGEFVILDKLGEGGYGAVYRAEQATLKREAVIKVLHARHRALQEVSQRFLREAQLASKLDHPFAAHIYAFGAEPDGVLWIAMELVRGTPLDRLLAQRGALSVEQFVPLLDRVCEVLATAHEQGIVHRDIKPANVMVLARAGRLLPKLLDFGIAKALDDSVPATGERVMPEVADLFGPESEPTILDPSAPVDAAATLEASLTRDGAVLGSPPYMAPELWNGGKVDARTDLYALGALAYEALTGRRAFDGPTLMAIAHAHAAGDIAPLGVGLPPELDGVLRRAMALRPDDRFPNALDFAAAFRGASGLVAGDRLELPQLDKADRERWMAEAPQPIAEAIAQLHAARSVHQAWDALWQVFEVVVRYLGLVALAGRAQSGGSDGERVKDKLLVLHKRRLSDEEWIELARALAEVDRGRRDAHAMPELLALFLDADPVWGGDPFAALLRIRERQRGVASDVETRKRFAEALPALHTLLRATSFLCDYALVVPRGGGVGERWMGLRLPRRRVSPLAGRNTTRERPLLANADGVPVLELWPLVQVGAPVPGTPEELFLLDGQGRYGAKLVALPTGFELLDNQVWEWFRKTLLDVAADAPGGPPVEERAPYRGLAAFGPEDAGSFFGREREIEEAVNKLQLQPLLAIVGPSGAGKSSFVHAGIVPALPAGWRAITVRPGALPLATLQARLTKEKMPVGDLRRDPTGLGPQLAALAGDGVIVLVIDQFEELFTLCTDAVERAKFAAALVTAAPSVEGPVRVVVTLRDDFLVRAEEEPVLRTHLSRALQVLTTPGAAELLRMVVEPARRAGYEFGDPALPEEMARELAGRPGALPLLSFTAATLWEARDRQFKQLTRRAYTAMGGVSGALAQHADETLAAMPADEQRLVRETFRHLVTSEGTRAVLTRRELVELLGSGAAEPVLEKLIGARLLTAQEGEGGVDRVEVAHEALLVAWPRLVAWRREDAEGARLRDQLRGAARQWVERGRPGGLLWRDEALAELKLWRARHGAALTAAESDFVEASLADERRARRVRRGLVASSFVVLVVVAVALAALGQRARRATAEVHARLLQSYEDQGRQAWLEGRPEEALGFLSEAYSGGRDGAALRYLLGRAGASLGARRAIFRGHDAPISSALLDGSGRQLLTAGRDGTARLWELASGAERAVLRHQAGLKRGELTPDGAHALTTDVEGVVRLWDVARGQATPLGAPAPLSPSARIAAPGDRAVSFEGTVARVWELPSGRPLATLAGHSAPITFVRVSADGRVLATLSADGVRLWDLRRGALLRAIAEPEGMGVDLGADGSTIATATQDGTVHVWSGTSTAPLVLPRGRGTLGSIALAPDGNRVVTAQDGALTVWDARTGRRLLRLEQVPPLWLLLFSPDGQRLAGLVEDGSVRVWELPSGRLLGTLLGHRGKVALHRFDGHLVVTSGEDGTARLWDVDRLDGALLLNDQGALAPNTVSLATFLGDGRVSVSDNRGRLLVWDAGAHAIVERFELKLPPPVNLQASHDGRAVVSFTTGAREAQLWDAGRRQLLHSFAGHAGPLADATFSADGALVATVAQADPQARLWEVASGRLRRAIATGAPSVGAVAFADNGSLVATGGSTGEIQVWDVATGALRATLRGHHGDIAVLSFSHDGRRFASAAADQLAIVWDLATGKPATTLDRHRGPITSVAFSPDDALLATASWDHTARVWDVASGAQLDALEHGDRVWSAMFGPDGERLATTAADGAVRVWTLPRERRPAAAIARDLRCRLFVRFEGGRPLVGDRPPVDCVAQTVQSADR